MQIYNPYEQSTGKVSISKGNQLKMHLDNKWYKADFLGYEGAAEYLSTALLKQSNIADFVDYQLHKITINEKTFNGCVSKHFLKENEELVTAYRLFLTYKGENIDNALKGLSLKEKIGYFVDTMEDITGISNLGQYLTLMLEWDRFVLNEGRHFNNIAFILSDNRFRIAPLFDNGAAFLSDTRDDYPLDKNIHGLMTSVCGKPFSEDFDKQTDACIELYGTQLKLNKTVSIPESVWDNIRSMYGDKVTERIHSVLEHQLCNYMEYLTVDITTQREELTQEPDL